MSVSDSRFRNFNSWLFMRERRIQHLYFYPEHHSRFQGGKKQGQTCLSIEIKHSTSEHCAEWLHHSLQMATNSITCGILSRDCTPEFRPFVAEQSKPQKCHMYVFHMTDSDERLMEMMPVKR
jgi:hypothetical protein